MSDVLQLIGQAKKLLTGVQGKTLGDAEIESATLQVAGQLLELARLLRTRDERRQERKLSRLLSDPRSLLLLTLITDRAPRSASGIQLVGQLGRLVDDLGIPQSLPYSDRLQLWALGVFGETTPELVKWGITARLRAETSPYILPGESSALTRRVHARRKAGIRLNINQLGEAILGDQEAELCQEAYLALLDRPETETVSVKVSSIVSHLPLLAWESCLSQLSQRLRPLYRAALPRPDRKAKLVYLDMEAYRDLHLTRELFTRLLSEPELHGLTAGMALQAYLPESFALQRELTAWSRARVAAGGAPIRLRLVKGANLAAEQVESALRGWDLPIYPSKLEVDGNFKRMLEYGCSHAQSALIGVGSHNLFDIAYGMVLRSAYRAEQWVEFELLEGMANPLSRAIAAVTGGVLLYAPAVEYQHFVSAVAYLVRRLDENAGRENFLRHSLGMEVGDDAWNSEAHKFVAALRDRHEVSSRSRRAQCRSIESSASGDSAASHASPSPSANPRAVLAHGFVNESDTDFTQACNRDWLWDGIATNPRELDGPLPLTVAGAERITRALGQGFDPSRPEAHPYEFSLATSTDIEDSLRAAAHAFGGWAKRPASERIDLMRAAAQQLRRQRGNLIRSMMLDAGKSAEQADAEVSEAIDFAEYYACNYAWWLQHGGVTLRPKGTILVAPPWNFPLAIPLGGVFAALVSGNTVILKPAIESVLVARRGAECVWAAGVPKDVLQFVMCEDAVASGLVEDPRTRGVILTGATETAQLLYRLRAELDLAAETGGKNAIIISSSADRELAIKELLQSAFGHAGQKCSAASLAIVEADVYDDPAFLRQLRDAAESLPVGSAWDLRAVVTPLIRAPGPVLERALTTLEPGESWLLEPRKSPNNDRLWSPGIKLGVQPGSYTHRVEFFGPLLGVLRARDLRHAIQLANDTPYGLTAGLFSLDEQEQALFCERMQAGNLYINRGITGAVVGRQPFGGRKASSFGPGAKAGGPHYLTQFCQIVDVPSQATLPRTQSDDGMNPWVRQVLGLTQALLEPSAQTRLVHVAAAFESYYRAQLACFQHTQCLPGQFNLLRYQPRLDLTIVAPPSLDHELLGVALIAALTCLGETTRARTPPPVAKGRRLLHLVTANPAHANLNTGLESVLGIEVCLDPEAAALRLEAGRLRWLFSGASTSEPSPSVASRLPHSGSLFLDDRPVSRQPWVELPRYTLEQSVSVNYHRYGNSGGRSLVERALHLPAGVPSPEFDD